MEWPSLHTPLLKLISHCLCNFLKNRITFSAGAYRGKMALRARNKFGAPCSSPRSFGSKCTVLKKLLATVLGLIGARGIVPSYPLGTPLVISESGRSPHSDQLCIRHMTMAKWDGSSARHEKCSNVIDNPGR